MVKHTRGWTVEKNVVCGSQMRNDPNTVVISFAAKNSKNMISESGVAPSKEMAVEKSVVWTGIDIGEEDLGVPEVPPSFPFYVYSLLVNYPDGPPGWPSWDDFFSWAQSMRYREEGWVSMHHMFLSASSIKDGLGADRYRSPHICKRDCITRPLKNLKTHQIMERGFHMEFLHIELFNIYLQEYDAVQCVYSMVHPTQQYIMATPDALLYEKGKGPKNPECVRPPYVAKLIAEFKTHEAAAHREVTPDHMAQIQATMQVVGAEECLISSLSFDNETLQSEWYLIRVKRSDAYWNAAIPVMRNYVRSVLHEYTEQNSYPVPPKGTFVSPPVFTEQVIHLKNVLSNIRNAKERISAALNTAYAAASENFSKEMAIRP
jgi:hypothetical protein